MSFIDFLYITSYFLIAFGAAIAVVAALGFSLHAEMLWTDRLVPAIAPLMVIGIALGSLLSGRNLALAGKHIGLLQGQLGAGANALRLLTVAILGIAITKLAGYFLRRRSAAPAPGTSLFAAVFIYVAAVNFLPSVMGARPAFFHSMLYPAVVFAAAWAGRCEPIGVTVRHAKYALYAMLLGSLLTALVAPGIAVQPDYSGAIPGLGIRLWGLGTHANSIGPLTLLTLLLEYLEPTRPSWLRVLLLAAAGSILVLAQSKTVWAAAIVAAAILAWYRCGNRHREKFFLLLIGAGAALLMASMFVDWDRLLDSSAGSSFSSLSGRTDIWEVALREWLRNPMFGYGPEIWGAEFRVKIGMPYAYSAHNQIFETLSMAGAVGLLALLVYLRYLVPATFRMAAKTHGVSVALLGIMLLRFVTEAPLAMYGLLDGEVLTHFLLFVIALRAGNLVQPVQAHGPVLAGRAT